MFWVIYFYGITKHEDGMNNFINEEIIENEMNYFTNEEMVEVLINEEILFLF